MTSPQTSEIRAQILDQTKTAMKEKDQAKLSTLRMVSAAIKQKDIDSRTADSKDGLSDEQILSLLQTLIKQRNESIKMYKDAGRDELAAKEQAEIEVIQQFLPTQLDGAELEAAVQSAITETSASGMQDMGKVMGILKSKYPGSLDMGKASAKVKAMLAA